MYYEGNGVPRDYKETVKWWRKAAEQGSIYAQYQLGLMLGGHREGKGMPQDYAEAAKWFRRLAEQGSDAGQYELGVMYYEGKGVPQDYAEAAKWFRRKPAEWGYGDARYYLGVMYEKGKGVPQDYVLAYMWFNISASNGNQLAVKGRDVVLKKMTPSQIEKAQTLTREWLEKNCLLSC